MAIAIQEVIADYMSARVRPEVDSVRETIPLGTTMNKPELADIPAEQPVLLIEYGSLKAIGHIIHYEQEGVTYLLGVIDGPIEDSD